jgi:threonylcarbamoyladenosine tRNA methylthiotransferase MtaB
MRYHSPVSTYYVENFGCRATQADGAALEHQLENHGLAPAKTSAQAELVVLNTCTVTNSADQDARAAIRRVHRQNPNAKIVVTGCYAQRAPEEIAALPGVSCVIGNSHKHQLADIVLSTHPRDLESSDDLGPRAVFGWRSASSAAENPALSEKALAPELSAFIPLTTLTAPAQNPLAENRELSTENRIFVSDIFAHTELLAAPVFDAANERSRPNLKVQDGCDNRCSFCVIPYVRGQSRSLPLDQILKEVNTLVAAGYRELVISGINLGRWGRDLPVRPQPSIIYSSRDRERQTSDPDKALKADARRPGTDGALRRFEDLIRTILAHTALEKLRVSSVEPMDWSDELIALVASSPRIAKHAHVPLQSGSDAVLRRMHRKYRPWHYREKIEKIRAAMPTAAIGADVMTGFPGETDAEFESTRHLIEELPFTYLHVFTYSARPGTPAAAMPHQVPVPVARDRNRILRDLAAQKKQAFMRSFIGKTVEAITLKSCGAGAPACEVSRTDSLGAGAPGQERSGTESPGSLATHHSEPLAAALQRSETERGSGQVFTQALTDNYLKLHLKGSHQPNLWLRAQVEDALGESLPEVAGIAGC